MTKLIIFQEHAIVTQKGPFVNPHTQQNSFFQNMIKLIHVLFIYFEKFKR